MCNFPAYLGNYDRPTNEPTDDHEDFLRKLLIKLVFKGREQTKERVIRGLFTQAQSSPIPVIKMSEKKILTTGQKRRAKSRRRLSKIFVS